MPVTTGAPSSSLVASSGDWVRDLTREGVEANPGPCNGGTDAIDGKCPENCAVFVPNEEKKNSCDYCKHHKACHTDVAGSINGWLSRLVGVELNPGPCQGAVSEAKCEQGCTLTPEEVKGFKPDGICDCGHSYLRHGVLTAQSTGSLRSLDLRASLGSESVGPKTATSTDTSASPSSFTALISTPSGSLLSLDQLASLGSESIGRVLIEASDNTWVNVGQCVCVIHPRLLLTATHVVFTPKGQKEHVRVLYTPYVADQSSKDVITQWFNVKIIRYAGQMDVSVLLIDGTSPFRPTELVSWDMDRTDIASDLSIHLICYPVASDLERPGVHHTSPDQATIQADKLSRKPECYIGRISKTEKTSTTSHPSDPSITPIIRHFTIAHASYTSFSSCSGGGVFLSAADKHGSLQLLGIHTGIMYQTDRSQILVDLEYDHHTNDDDDTFDQAHTTEDKTDETVTSSISTGDGETIIETVDTVMTNVITRTRRKRKRVSEESSSSESSKQSSASSNTSSLGGSANTTPIAEPTPTKAVKYFVKDEMKQKAGQAEFVIAHTALHQHPDWAPNKLKQIQHKTSMASATGQTIILPPLLESSHGKQRAFIPNTIHSASSPSYDFLYG